MHTNASQQGADSQHTDLLSYQLSPFQLAGYRFLFSGNIGISSLA
jgi:hypothetical protein